MADRFAVLRLEGSVAFRPPANASLLAPVRGVVRTVDRIYHGGGKAGYLLYIDEQRFQLDMERDESLLSHHFGLNADATPPRRECVYRGTVNSNAESLALFNLCGGGLDGFFAVDNARYTVTPLIRAKGHENDARVVEDADATRALHYYTRESFGFEAMPARHSCGTTRPQSAERAKAERRADATQALRVPRAARGAAAGRGRVHDEEVRQGPAPLPVDAGVHRVQTLRPRPHREPHPSVGG